MLPVQKATELWKEEEHRLKTETNTNAANVNLTLGNYARNLKNDLKTMHRLVQQQRRRTSQHQGACRQPNLQWWCLRYLGSRLVAWLMRTHRHACFVHAGYVRMCGWCA